MVTQKQIDHLINQLLCIINEDNIMVNAEGISSEDITG